MANWWNGLPSPCYQPTEDSLVKCRSKKTSTSTTLESKATTFRSKCEASFDDQSQQRKNCVYGFSTVLVLIFELVERSSNRLNFETSESNLQVCLAGKQDDSHAVLDHCSVCPCLIEIPPNSVSASTSNNNASHAALL